MYLVDDFDLDLVDVDSFFVLWCGTGAVCSVGSEADQVASDLEVDLDWLTTESLS